MIYFTAKSELELIKQYLMYFEEIILIESQIKEKLINDGQKYLTSISMNNEIRETALKENSRYKEVRTEYAKMLPLVKDICCREMLSINISGTSAPLEGETPFSGTIFELILIRPSELIDFNNYLRDIINQAIGITERNVNRELWELINPFYWIKIVALWIIRFPYKIIELSGFDIKKVEEHLIAKVIHLLYLLSVTMFLLWLGIDTVSRLEQFIILLIKP
jgi:hypothetical protein